MRPILRGHSSKAQRLLLSAVQLDVPPTHGKKQALSALGLSGALCATSRIASSATVKGAKAASVSNAAGPLGVVSISALKGGAIGLVAGALLCATVVAVLNVTRSSPANSEPSHYQSSNMSHGKAHLEQEGQGHVAPATSATPNMIATPVPSSSEVTSVGPASASQSLASEVALLDTVQRALASGQLSVALQNLDTHQKRFRHPHLLSEATVLRIETLLALDRVAEAKKLGEQLLVAQPDGALAQRVRTMLGLSASGVPRGADTHDSSFAF